MPKKTKYLALLLITLIVVGLIYFLFSNTPSRSPSTPQTSTNPTPIPLPQNTGRYPLNLKIGYQGPIFTPPETLPVYTSSTTPLREQAQQLVDDLGLTPLPNSSVYWTNRDKGISLNLNAHTQTLILSITPKDSSLSPGINPTQAAQTATSQLSQMGLKNAVVNPSQAFFLTNPNEYLHTSASAPPDEALMVVMPFHFSIEDYPLQINGLGSDSMQVIVDSQYRIRKVVFHQPPANYKILGEYTPNTLNQALNQLQTGNGIITSIDADFYIVNLPLSDIRYAILDTVEIQYRLETDSGQIFPYYRFTGEAVLAQGKADVEIITPAL